MVEHAAIEKQLNGDPVRFPAADGLMLGGFLWARPRAELQCPIVVICAATSVRCRYYARFAAYLFEHGFDVLTYDYRGIGESRPASLRGFAADWVDWGEKDLQGALQFVDGRRSDQPIFIVGHSIGGFALGMAPSNRRISRVLTVGAQFAFWRDYPLRQRLRMLLKWHVIMPLLTSLFGYFPAKKLGWMEDTPKGVVRDWSRMGSRFEKTLRLNMLHDGRPQGEQLVDRCRQLEAPILAISLSDDPHGTVSAVDRLLAYFTGSRRLHMQLEPADIGADAIGHFAFFHDRFRDTLWPLALGWLRDGDVPPAFAKALLQRHES